MSKHDFSNYPFSPEKWATCLKVLTALKDNPTENPDNETFKTLISKIKKGARKQLRKANYQEKKQADTAIIKQAKAAQNALSNSSLYQANDSKTVKQFTALNLPKNCYACNQSFKKAHFFYNRLCPDCAVLNYQKRTETADLQGRNAIITGGRVKIGYATALKLLQAGANVIVTSRFPALAFSSFQQEPDFAKWQNRLTCYGLDLRSLAQIEQFIQFYKSKFDSLNILINNAAQTIKYPDDYYLPIIAQEEKLLALPEVQQKVIPNKIALQNPTALLANESLDWESLPKNRFGQPVDEREKTSWNATLSEVSTVELLEVSLINQFAPYLLIKELRPWLEKSPFAERFVINVTSSEGQFSYTNKTIFHPHTNMTKAALNMMTLTAAKEFAQQQIYMNAVDVGWVSTGATESLRKRQFERGYIPPLDSVDGAGRIFQPIISGLEGNYFVGKLLKNYRVEKW